MTDTKGDSSESEHETLSHKELLEVTSRTLTKLLSQDPLLKDLPVGVTVDEVIAQIALHHGQSMTVYVVREDNDEMPIVVSQTSATVRDLKMALKRHMVLRLQRQKSVIKVSWPYIWRTYWLTHNLQPLKNDSDLLSDYAVLVNDLGYDACDNQGCLKCQNYNIGFPPRHHVLVAVGTGNKINFGSSGHENMVAWPEPRNL